MKEVTAAIIERHGKILIAKRKKGDKLENKWEFPGGTVEDDETFEKCLSREMMEEFGIEVSVGICLGENIYHYNHGSIRLISYFASWTDNELVPKAHDEIRWVTREELQDFDFSPADVPFVDKLRSGELPLVQSCRLNLNSKQRC